MIAEVFRCNPFVRIAMSLVAGILLGGSLYGVCGGAEAVVASAGTAVVLVITGAIAGQKVMHSFAQLPSLLILLGMFFMGMALRLAVEQRADAALPAGMADYKVIFAEEPVMHGRVAMADCYVAGGPLAGRKIRLSIMPGYDKGELPHTGQCVCFTSRMCRPENFSRGFDYALYMRRHGYAAVAFVYASAMTVCSVSLSDVPVMTRAAVRLSRLRDSLLVHHVAKRHDGSVVSEDDGALIAAVALGSKKALDKDLRDAYSVAGASHVLALSGLHLSILFSFLKIAFGRRPRWWKHTLLIILIWLFVFLVGCPVSVCRAALMLTVYSLAGVMGRPRMSLNALSMALVVLLLADPLSIFDVGLQMSFIAVLAIIISQQWINGLCNPKSKLLGWLWQLMAVSVAAQLGTAPLAVFYFHRFPMLFLVTNIFVIPLTYVVLLSFALYMILAWPAWLHAIAGSLCFGLARIMNGGVRIIASLPFAAVEDINVSAWHVMLLYIAAGGIIFLLTRLAHALRVSDVEPDSQ